VKLDYWPNTRRFTLEVARNEADPRVIMEEQGFDLSIPMSTAVTAVLYTGERYAAAPYWEVATERAREALLSIHQEVQTSWAMDSGAHIACPADQELAGFQKAGVEYALRRTNTLIGDQPGLGKTMQAICVANEMRAKRVLVLCPANIRLQWAARINAWTTMKWPYTVHVVLHGRHGIHPTAAWTVVSYDLARTAPIWRALAEGAYDLLILDEAHYLKSVDAERTRTVFGGGAHPLAVSLASQAGAVLALTGTPLPNRPREAYTLARGLCLGADTRVLTYAGVKPITDLLKTDLLWDGHQWVKHGGVIYNGQKRTLRAAGLSATPDHLVRVGGGWVTWQNLLEDGNTQFRALATGLVSPEICAGPRGLLMQTTNERLHLLPSASEGWGHVFDIVNVGPRQRFTVLTDVGALLVHNCWDSIDWMSEDRFRGRFNPSVQRETPDGKIWIDERTGRHGELQSRLRANFMVRRLKRDVLPQLKLPSLDIVYVEETGAVKAALKAESMLKIDPTQLEGLDRKAFGHVSVIRRQMGVAIAPLAAEYVQLLLDGGEEKVVVFAWHIEVLDILQKKLAKFSPLRIDGSTTATNKTKIVAQFAKPGARVLLGNILSLGTGTDGLQEACQRGVAAEASWVAGDNEQAIDRLDRMGQKGSVLFDFLVAKGSFSEHVLGTSLRKRQNTHMALDAQLEAW
jgi:hypothetical protein